MPIFNADNPVSSSCYKVTWDVGTKTALCPQPPVCPVAKHTASRLSVLSARPLSADGAQVELEPYTPLFAFGKANVLALSFGRERMASQRRRIHSLSCRSSYLNVSS